MSKETFQQNITNPKDPGSALANFIGVILVILAALLNKSAFGWLLAGGIIYTIGGIIYACKFPVFNRLHKNFGSHEIFHCFVLAGSLCHFVTMYCI